MKIQVTQENIAKGSRYDQRCCPIALAMKDAGFTGVLVGVVNASAYLKREYYTFTVPLAGRLFIEDFDNGKPVEPMELELRSNACSVDASTFVDGGTGEPFPDTYWD